MGGAASGRKFVLLCGGGDRGRDESTARLQCTLHSTLPHITWPGQRIAVRVRLFTIVIMRVRLFTKD